PSTATPSTSTPPTTPTERELPHGYRRRGHRLDPPPVLLPGQHLGRRRPAALRRRVGGQDRGVPPDAHPGRARRPGHGGQRPLPPAVAGQHAAVPGGQGA